MRSVTAQRLRTDLGAPKKTCGGPVPLPIESATVSTPKESKGRSNKLACQIGEFLVCAELGRRGLIATPFAGNVPAFDILVADRACNTVPIQVKATRGDNWRTDARIWMEIELDRATGTQIFLSHREIENRDLIYVHVVIAQVDGDKDQFFILNKEQLQRVIIDQHKAWMDTKGWRRPKNPASFECRYTTKHLEPYQDNWNLIIRKLQPA